MFDETSVVVYLCKNEQLTRSCQKEYEHEHWTWTYETVRIDNRATHWNVKWMLGQNCLGIHRSFTYIQRGWNFRILVVHFSFPVSNKFRRQRTINLSKYIIKFLSRQRWHNDVRIIALFSVTLKMTWIFFKNISVFFFFIWTTMTL